MKKFIRKYYRLLFAILISVSFLVTYSAIFSVNYKGRVRNFKTEFRTLETKLDDELNKQLSALKANSAPNFWKIHKSDNDIYFHVFRNDSLIFWNTNQLPILRFADIHFPADGILHLQNGWYYAKTKIVDHYILCASFLIKKDYPYENKSLSNTFSPNFSIPFSAYIVLEQQTGFPIYDQNKNYLFSLLPNEYQLTKGTKSIILLLLLEEQLEVG